MAASLTTGAGVPVRLGSVLASAGEGVIYEVAERPDLVAKVFHPNLRDLGAKLNKVGAMIATPPEGAVQADGFVVLTWPTALLDGNDAAVGYLMPRIDTSYAVEIHTVSNPANRSNPLPGSPTWTPNVTWSHLVNVAANLCLAVDIVHRVNAVIGDFQERNILVNDTTRVTLVDCDSMQFIDDAGRLYPCGVARAEFTAPELAGVNLAATERGKPSDLFALAVHIHLLLLAGNHPFLRGEWTGAGEQPDALTLAASGQWAGGPGSALHTHPLAPPVSFLPDDVHRLFVRAFTEGAKYPHARPTAAEWRDALLRMQLGTCARGHQIPIEADPCPWCVIDDHRAARRQARGWNSAGASTDQVVYRVDSPAPAYAAPPPSAPRPSAGGLVPSQSGGVNRNLLVGLGVAAVLLIGLVAVFLVPSERKSQTASTATAGSEAYSSYPTTATSRVAGARPSGPPAGANPCGEPVAGTYSRAAGGTSTTSCQFVISVRDAVNATGEMYPARVTAYSPVTNKWYEMSCALETVLTCRGGKNAVVHVY